MGNNYEMGRPIPEKKETEYKNVAEVQMPEADYKILYTQHNFQANPELVNNTDAVILELMGETYNDEGMQQTGEWLQNANLSPYKEIVKMAAEKQVPVFMTDLSFATRTSSEVRNRIDLDTLKSALEISLGVMGVSLGVTVLSNESLSRREFLKKGAMAMIGVGAYGASPILKYVMQIAETKAAETELDDSRSLRKIEKKMDELEEIIHPELKSMLLNVRNDIFALKSKHIASTLAKQGETKPRIGIAIGMGHTGLERSLHKEDNEIIQSVKEGLGKHVADERFIARLDFSKGEEEGKLNVEVSFIEVPELKQ